jgi:DNA-binding MarR family transcriptional regulator
MKLSSNQQKVLIYLNDNEAPSLEQIISGTGLGNEAVRKALARLKELGFVNAPEGLLDRATEILNKLDDKLTPTSNGFAEYIILIASLISKADEKFLAQELEYDPEFVAMVGSRLRSAKIWVEDQVSALHRTAFEDESNPAAFWMAGLVAMGDFKIVSGHDDEPKYAFTDHGKKRAEILARPQGTRGV